MKLEIQRVRRVTRWPWLNRLQRRLGLLSQEWTTVKLPFEPLLKQCAEVEHKLLRLQLLRGGFIKPEDLEL